MKKTTSVILFQQTGLIYFPAQPSVLTLPESPVQTHSESEIVPAVFICQNTKILFPDDATPKLRWALFSVALKCQVAEGKRWEKNSFNCTNQIT